MGCMPNKLRGLSYMGGGGLICILHRHIIMLLINKLADWPPNYHKTARMFAVRANEFLLFKSYGSVLCHLVRCNEGTDKGSLEVFLNGAELSLNSENLINH